MAHLKITNSILILLLIVFSASCGQLKSNNIKKQHYLRLENNLSKVQVKIINNLIMSFDSALVVRYPNIIIPEKRVNQFIDELIGLYKKQEYGVVKKKCGFISPHLISIKKSGLLDEIWVSRNSNYKSLYKITKWLDSINKIINHSTPISEIEDVNYIDLNKNSYIIIDTIRGVNDKLINNQHSFNYELNFNGLFYYSIYQASGESNEKIKIYIINRIDANNISPILSLIKVQNLFEEKEMNNTLFKTIILFEFVLPNFI